MTRFLKNITFFSVPLVIWSVFMAIIDPYNYFGLRMIPDNIKIESLRRGRIKTNQVTLWKTIEYKKLKTGNILLGDSRMAALNVNDIENESDLQVYNFAVPGNDIQSICDQFWYADKIANLKNVYINIPFHFFRTSYDNKVFKRTKAIITSPLKYVTTKWICEGAIDIVSRSLNHGQDKKPDKVKQPTNTIGKVNEHELSIYSHYTFDYKKLDEFQKIIDYAKANDIHLEFVIFPNYKEVRNKVIENGLQNDYLWLTSFFKRQAIVHDFNFDNNITLNLDNYYDYFHTVPEINQSIIKKIWGRHQQATIPNNTLSDKSLMHSAMQR